MAWRMKLKLPVFKVTQRSSSGVVHRNVPRGKEIVDCDRNDDSSVPEEAACALDSPTSDPSFIDPISEPSLEDFGDHDDGKNPCTQLLNRVGVRVLVQIQRKTFSQMRKETIHKKTT